MSEKPTAVDLFCGGGGFSEGLRQAGFNITHAVDIDSGAVETHELNHPETETIQADIMDIEPEDFPDDVDVLFGSPPCTEFSWAKSGGGGDIEAGMKLVKRFLYFVDELEPDYWVMENVPRLNNYLPETIDFADVPWGESTHTVDITKVVLDGDEYGTPQRRSRLFSGEFPVPEPTGEPVPSFGDINQHFPTPAKGIPSGETVTDPSYDIELSAKELTDHFYISHVTNREAEEIRVRKEDHSFYGRMSFPDDPEVPSRTVLATNRRVARETLVMAEDEEDIPDGISRFRKPTIREIASIQGFPITYQFTGTSQAKKWRRVGDAVPPTMAFRVGCAIRKALGVEVPDEPDLYLDTPHPETNLSEEEPSWRGRRRLSISRNFRHHVPVDSKQKFRVDLETDKKSNPPHPLSKQVDTDLVHPVEFTVKLYRGYSKNVVSTSVDLEMALDLAERLIQERPELEEDVRKVVTEFKSDLGPKVPDATTLQGIRSRRCDPDEPVEFNLLKTISSYDGDGIVDEIISKKEGENGAPFTVDGFFDDETQLPVRVLLKLVGATYLAEKLNRCGQWIRDNPEETHIPEDFPVDASDVDPEAATCLGDACVDSTLEAFLSTSGANEPPISASTD